ncbi:SDR family oxidoreductase [Fodinicola acaciae]|uniref:SDR family oxidoreductase n=1 Tax=Fodinicola acaciae TaxID=2681555 RepID=UPI0013D1360A|nr:SDR family oxidoreductase [Fodinicola acaciae]
MATRRVLVTGSSTGIGRATAKALADRGWWVYAAVRKGKDADSLRADLGASGAPILLDVTNQASIDAAAAEIGGPLHAVVNNAGIAVGAPLEFLPLDDFRQQLEVNVTGQLAVTQAFLPRLRETRGRLLFVGSIGGRIAGPLIGAYHASKFALAGMTDTLRAELRPFGVQVVLIEPGTIATSIWGTAVGAGRALYERMPAEAQRYYGAALEAVMSTSEERGSKGLAPAAAAKVLVRVLETARPRPRYLIGRDARMASVLPYLPASLRAWLVAQQMQAGPADSEPAAAPA